MLNRTGEKGQGTLLRCVGCHLRLPQGPEILLLLPGSGLLTEQSATTAPGGCQHQQMLYLQRAQDDRLPHLYLAAGREGRPW